MRSSVTAKNCLRKWVRTAERAPTGFLSAIALYIVLCSFEFFEVTGSDVDWFGPGLFESD